ncbi:C40 family peptidase [Corynebacterium aquatimens]|nr:C40 family peptidase [Corynebacterium aquatimens]
MFSPVAGAQTADGSQGAAALVSAVARAQAQVDALTLGIGDLHESVNRALVDLRDAQAVAEQARRGAAEAEERLRESEAAVEQARAELAVVTRSQYRGTNESGLLGALAGRGKQRDVLERAQFLRQRTDEKRAALEAVEQARIEAANEAAVAREAAELAEAAAADAATAEQDARALYEANVETLAAQTAELEQAEATLGDAQASLEEVRPGARDAAGADAAAYAAPAVVEFDAEVIEQVQQRAEELAPEAGVPSAEAVAQALSTAQAARGEAPAAAAEEDVAGAAEAEAAEPVSVDVIEQASEIAAASALVGASQTPHATFANPYAGAATGYAGGTALGSSGSSGSSASRVAGAAHGAGEIISAFAGGLQSGMGLTTGDADRVSEAVNAAATGNATISDAANIASAIADVAKVLPEVTTPETVTEKVQTTVAAPNSGSVETVIARAMSMVGTPYVWGGGDANGPTTGLNGGTLNGFDCSGLVLYSFAAAGVSLPHYTGYQYQRGTKVDPSEAQRGDLLFWGPGGDQHVAIYLGDGMMIEAPRAGQNVSVVPVRWSGMSEHAVRLL